MNITPVQREQTTMKKLTYAVCGVLTMLTVASCNDNSTSSEPTVISSAAKIISFRLSAPDSVLHSMDSVYFSIDQQDLHIFNADSLPMNTDITALTPNISTSGASMVEIHIPRPGQTDSIINYLENTQPAVNFANGPVKVRVVSLNGATTSIYTIKVNVHKAPADTLMWSRMENQSLPSRFSVVTRQHTTMIGDKLACLTFYDGQYCLATTDQPTQGWEYVTPQFGFTPDMDSFTGGEDAMFMLDTNGQLHASTDGISWTATGYVWSHIYGYLNGKLVGAKFSNGIWSQVTFPSSAEKPLPAALPISGTSAPITFTPEMGISSQMIVTGGRKADGTLSKATWGFDGNEWAMFSRRQLPYGIENMAIVPYFTVKTSTTTWRTTKQSVLMAMCGNRIDGTPNDTVFVSRDFGINWEKADSLTQLPSTIPPRTRAQAFTVTSVLGAGAIRPLATKPIEQWDCPYIYLFGGVNQEGVTYNTMYRGVINRFTFKPLQ